MYNAEDLDPLKLDHKGKVKYKSLSDAKQSEILRIFRSVSSPIQEIVTRICHERAKQIGEFKSSNPIGALKKWTEGWLEIYGEILSIASIHDPSEIAFFEEKLCTGIELACRGISDDLATFTLRARESHLRFPIKFDPAWIAALPIRFPDLDYAYPDLKDAEGNYVTAYIPYEIDFPLPSGKLAILSADDRSNLVSRFQRINKDISVVTLRKIHEKLTMCEASGDIHDVMAIFRDESIIGADAEPYFGHGYNDALKKGQECPGVVKKIDDMYVLVDIGVNEPLWGKVGLRELSDKPGIHPSDIVNLGQVVNVKILVRDVEHGKCLLSLKRAKQAKSPLPKSDAAAVKRKPKEADKSRSQSHRRNTTHESEASAQVDLLPKASPPAESGVFLGNARLKLTYYSNSRRLNIEATDTGSQWCVTTAGLSVDGEKKGHVSSLEIAKSGVFITTSSSCVSLRGSSGGNEFIIHL